MKLLSCASIFGLGSRLVRSNSRTEGYWISRTMGDAYQRLQRDMKTYFPEKDNDDDLDNDNITDPIYKNSIAGSYFPSYLNVLPKEFHSETNRKSILDRLRITQSSEADDLGLPEIRQPDAMTLYNDNSYVNLKNENNLVIQPNEDAFANSLIVPNRDTGHITQKKNHSPWKLLKLLLGHTGQVTSVTMDPFNSFFVTGSADRTMKIWDLASGNLQLTLSGHIMAVRDMVISPRHPYLFSCSEDKTVKCWDLEKNVVIRDYHGHLSAVYTIDIHPELDVIVTGGRDSSVRVWDIRTRTPIHVLTGHRSSVNKVKCQSNDPQVISCSMDSTVRTWDLAAGKCMKTLTFHSKSVRAFCLDEGNEELITSSSDGIKKFKLPECQYQQDLQFWKNHNVVEEGNLIVNTMCNSTDGVVFAGCDGGKFAFWDWQSGEMFQNDVQVPVPGSLDSEGGILCSTFDHSGERLITGNIDKSVRILNKVIED